MALLLHSITTQPFLAGLVSACSMPLGAVTSFLWQPRNRTTSFLMAFGAGALLSALVIDLVGTARERGHLIELGVGSILGSLFYTGVNTLVNRSGGFLRKPSTLISHLAGRDSRRKLWLTRQLSAIDLWSELKDSELKVLASQVLILTFDPGQTLFRKEDPSESLYMLLEGSVDLLDPDRGGEIYATLNAGDIVGRLSFLTGTPHRMVAVCATKCRIASLGRSEFERHLQASGGFASRVESMLTHPEVMSYLIERERLRPAQVDRWLEEARRALRTSRFLPDAVVVDRGTTSFLRLARHIEKFPVFANLPDEELKQVSDRLIYAHFDDGHAFFQAGESADRLFILEQGEAELLDPSQPRLTPRLIKAGQALGEFSFLTDLNHTVTAVARSVCTGWALRRADFNELLQRCPALDQAVEQFLAAGVVSTYLERKHGFSQKMTLRWTEKAMGQMQRGYLIPSARSLLKDISSHASVPVAIWIGLLMDGIPEALTIGAHVVLAPLSPSLLVGLFVANYPESLSSSHGMRQQGFPLPLILGMWSGLSLLTGLLAWVGAILFLGVSERWVSLIGAMAAGAMLTVISETMLPESYAKGGSVVGFSTILGFLAIIYINSAPH